MREDLENRAVYMTGDFKTETICVGKERVTLPIGTICKYLMELDDAYWKSVVDVSNRLHSLCQDVEPLKPQNAWRDYEYVKDVLQACAEATMLMSIPAPRIMQLLTVFLPAYDGYNEDWRKLVQVEPSARELDDARRAYDLEQTKELRDLSRENHIRRLNDMTKVRKRMQQWDNMIDRQDGTRTEDDLVRILSLYETRDDIFQIIDEYGANLYYTVVEARKLAVDLRTLHERSVRESLLDAIENELINYPDFPARLSKPVAKKVFPDTKMRKHQDAYSITRLSQLVSLEMQIIAENGLEFRKCKFCGGLFLTREERAKYCPYPYLRNEPLPVPMPFEKYKGKVCKEHAAQSLYGATSDLKAKYNKNYGAYKRWVSRVLSKDEDKMYDKYRKLHGVLAQMFNEEDEKLAWELITYEVKHRNRDWRKAASEAVKAYEKGEISAESCRTAIAVPRVEYRSPILASFDGGAIDLTKKDLREFAREKQEREKQEKQKSQKNKSKPQAKY